jgi:hypothetical protein
VLERVFEEARVSGELADHLRRQLATLQSTPGSQIVQAPLGAVLELEGSTPTLALLEAAEAKSTTGSRGSPGPINVVAIDDNIQTRMTRFPGHESLGGILLRKG